MPITLRDRNYAGEGQTSVRGLTTPDETGVSPLDRILNAYNASSGNAGGTDTNNFNAAFRSLAGTQGNATNANLTGQAEAQTQAANTALRTNNLADVNRLSEQAYAARRAQNSNLYGALDQVAQNVGTPYRTPYQGLLGAQFDQGPQFSQVSPSSVSGQSVTASQISGAPLINASQIGGYNSVASGADPLLGYAQQQASNSGYGELGNRLNSLAQQQLALGGSLSEEDTRNSQQAAREAWSARGLVNSRGAVGAEVLNRDALSRQRLAERTGMAQSINSQLQSQQGLNNQYTLGVLGAGQGANTQSLQAQIANQGAGMNMAQLNQAAQQQAALANQGTSLDVLRANQAAQQQASLANQNVGLQAGLSNAQLGLQGQLANQSAGMAARQQNQGLGQYLAGLDSNAYQQGISNLFQNANLQSQNQFDPFGTLLGQQYGMQTNNQGNNATLFNQAAALSSGALGNQYAQKLTNPYNDYANDVYGTNTNAAYGAQISAANNAAAIEGARLSGQYNIGGSIIKNASSLYDILKQWGSP